MANFDVCDDACHTSQDHYLVVVSNSDAVEVCSDHHVEETDFICNVSGHHAQSNLVALGQGKRSEMDLVHIIVGDDITLFILGH